MKTRRDVIHLGLALVALLPVIVIPVTAIGADRVVLSEEFSSTT